MRQIIIIGVAAWLAACGNTPKSGNDGTSNSTPLVSITHGPRNPTYITLRLLDRTDQETTVSYAAKGLFNEDTVGLIVEVDKNIPAGISFDGKVDEKAGFKTGSIKFIRSGEESDRFVAALGEIWNVNGVTRMKTQPIQPLVFSSNRAEVNLDKSSTYSFKLFFGADAPVPGEVFFTLDTYKKTVEFQEKDAVYRSQIVRTFAEE